MGFISNLVKIFRGHEPYEVPSSFKPKSDKKIESGLKLLDTFMAQVEIPFTMHSPHISFDNDIQRLKYLYFYLGAADRIAAGMFDSKKEADMFFMVAALSKAIPLYGQDNATLIVDSYGKAEPDTPEHEAGRKGWESIEIFGEIINSNAKTQTTNQLRGITYALYDVVKG